MVSKHFKWMDEDGGISKGLISKTIMNLDLMSWCLLREPTAKEREKYREQGWILRRERGNKFWQMSANDTYGFPTLYDWEFFNGIIALEFIHNGVENFDKEVRYNPTELYLFIGKDAGGKSYAELRRALDRIVSVTFKTNMALTRGESSTTSSSKKKRAVITTFKLLQKTREPEDKLTLAGRKGSDESNPFPRDYSIILTDDLFSQVKNKLITNIDYSILATLKPIDQMFYRFVNVALYSANSFRKAFHIHDLAMLLNIRENQDNKLVARLRNLIKKQIEVGVLEELPDYGFSRKNPKTPTKGEPVERDLFDKTRKINYVEIRLNNQIPDEHIDLAERVFKYLETLTKSYPDKMIPNKFITELIKEGADEEHFVSAGESYFQKLERAPEDVKTPGPYFRILVHKARDGSLNTYNA